VLDWNTEHVEELSVQIARRNFYNRDGNPVHIHSSSNDMGTSHGGHCNSNQVDFWISGYKDREDRERQTKNIFVSEHENI
jgi:hypothetical protein